MLKILLVVSLVGCGAIEDYEREQEKTELEKQLEHEKQKKRLEEAIEKEKQREKTEREQPSNSNKTPATNDSNSSVEVNVDVDVDVNFEQENNQESDKLYPGMPVEDVLKVLGTPEAVYHDGFVYENKVCGFSPYCEVVFNPDGLLIQQDNIDPQYLDIYSWMD